MQISNHTEYVFMWLSQNKQKVFPYFLNLIFFRSVPMQKKCIWYAYNGRFYQSWRRKYWNNGKDFFFKWSVNWSGLKNMGWFFSDDTHKYFSSLHLFIHSGVWWSMMDENLHNIYISSPSSQVNRKVTFIICYIGWCFILK